MRNKLLSKKANNLFFFFVLILLFTVSLSNAANRFSVATGNWSSTATWSATLGGASGASVPVAGDVVTIAGGFTVTLSANAACTDVTVNAGSTLNIATRRLTTTGFFINNGSVTGTTGIIMHTGSFTNSGSFTLTSGQLTIATGNFTNSGTFTLRTGRLIVSVGTFSSTNSFTFTGAGMLVLGGNFSYSGTFTLLSAQVQFTGTANQSIQGFTTTGTVSMLKTGGTASLSGNVNGAGLTMSGAGGTLNLVSGTHTFSGSWIRANGTLNCGSSLFRIGRNVSGTGGAFTAGSGTVEYYRGGGQTAGILTYNNLILSGSSTKTFANTPTVNGVLSMQGTATVNVSSGAITYGANATLQYNTASARNVGATDEWITPFTASGGVIIANTGKITMTVAKTFNATAPLTVNSSAQLGLGTVLLTLNGNFINNGLAIGTTGGVTITGTATQSIGAFTTTGTVSMTKASGTATLTGNINGAGLTINGVSGTLNLGTGLIHTFNGAVALNSGTLNGGSSRLNVNFAGSAWNGTGSNFNRGTGTVNFGGAAQTLVAVSTFNNLIFSNSGIKTLTGLPTINGILSMEGTATVSVVPNYGSSATLQYNRSVSQGTGPEWKTPFTSTGGVSVINTGTITCGGAKIFNSGVPLSIVGGATLDNGGFAISSGSTLSVADTGILVVSGVSVFPSGFGTTNLSPTSTVEYTGAVQSIATHVYGNLILTGSGSKNFSNATTIVGNLEITGSAVAILPNGTLSSASSILFSEVLQASGNWGGTGSGATFKSGPRFGSTTTGIISNISCTVGYWLGGISTDWNVAGNWCGSVLPTAITDVTIAPAVRQPILSASGVCRNITIASGASLGLASNTLTVSGNWTNNGGTFTAGTGTVVFNGIAAQSIGGTSVSVFNNLTNANTSAALTAGRGITVNGILSMSNVASLLEMQTFALSGGASFSNTGAGQIRTSNTTSLPIPTGKTWNNTIVYLNPTGGQTIVGGTYNGTPSLEMDNTSGIQTASGAIVAGGQLNINNGGTPTFKTNGFPLTINALNLNSGATLDMGTGVFSYATLVAMNGTVRFSGAANGLAFPSGTVEYYNTTPTVAIVAEGVYYDLLFSGTGTYTIGSNIEIANTLTVNSGALKVLDSFSVSVEDAVIVYPLATFTLENNASLVQTDYTGPNTGKINVIRNTTPIVFGDYTYWSSPTTGTQTLYDFSPDTQSERFFDHNNSWANVNPVTTVFEPGIGYAIRSSVGTNPTIPSVDTSYQFVGVPNNGTTVIPLAVRAADNKGDRLLGNPYPSAIDADAFINANVEDTGTINQTITGTLYFWTHNHAISGYDYMATDYATYNLFGSVGVASGTGNLTDPSQYIASGQGFFVQNKFAGDVTFDNSMRIIENNANFYRQKKVSSEEESSRIWLKLAKNAVDVTGTLVGYGSNSTNGYDSGYDSYVYDKNQSFSIYSFIETEKMAIQSKVLPFVDTDTFPLGYSINVSGNATISIEKVDGLFVYDQPVYLEDKVLNVVHNIVNSPYTFSTTAGTFNDRFVLRYTDKTLGTDDFESIVKSVLISKNKSELRIKSAVENIKNIAVYDLLGRKVFEKSAVNNTEFSTSDFVLRNQIVVVKVTLENGKTVSQKVVF
jgi:hypothetical protein